MRTRYFRKKDPFCKPEAIEWIEMNGREYYSFVTDPQNKDRFFIDMGDVVLEVTEAETRDYKAEKNHNYYIRTQEGEWSTVSLYAAEDANGCSGEEVAVDEAQDVETQVLMRLDSAAVREALIQLDEESYRLIWELYLAAERKTERELAQILGVSQNAVNKQKNKILKSLKILVVKIQKSQQ